MHDAPAALLRDASHFDPEVAETALQGLTAGRDQVRR